MSLIKKIINKFKNEEVKNEVATLKKYTQAELENAKYEIFDIYRVRLTRKVKIKNMAEPIKEAKSIIAIRVNPGVYMDIETGEYYEANTFIDDLDQLNVYVANEMPFRYYVCEALTDSHIDWNESITAKQCREMIKLQKERYKYPMYDPKSWGIR